MILLSFSSNTLRKSLQTTSASSCRIYMLLTSSVLSTTSKQCFEQPAARFLVCSLIFIEYKSQVIATNLLSIADSELVKLISNLLPTRCLIYAQVFDEKSFNGTKNRIFRFFFNCDEKMP